MRLCKADDLKVGGVYLAKKGSSTVYQLEVLAVSKTSVRLRYESGNTSWVTKEDFDFDYLIIEKMDFKYYENIK